MYLSLSLSLTVKKRKKKRKKPLANRKIQEPSALKRKILAEHIHTCDRRTGGEGGKRQASVTVFCIAMCMNKAGPWSGCPVSNPDPENAIGLLQEGRRQCELPMTTDFDAPLRTQTITTDKIWPSKCLFGAVELLY